MSEIAILYHETHSDFATVLATELRSMGFSVFAGPRRINSFDSYSNIKSFTKQTNAANIILLSLPLFRDYAQIVEAFSEAVVAGQFNIQIVSMDADWRNIKGSTIEHFKSVSYFQEARPNQPHRDPADLAKAIANASTHNSAMGVSHLTRDRLLHILRGSYDTIDEGLDVNEQGGRISFSEINCIHRSSGERERYIAVYPKAALEATADYIRYNYSSLLADSVRRFIVRSEPTHELSVRQREKMESLFSAKALRFESMVGGRRLRPARPPHLTDEREFVIPQRWVAGSADDAPEIETDKLFELCMQQLPSESQRRITILNGAGGAGKTHFVRFLNDRLVNAGKDVFFLSAASILDDQRDSTINSLFDIYKISCAADDTRSDVGRDLFDVKFFVDSPIIIVDGLEEIITMLGDRFAIDRFYADCVEKISGDANGRIVITTRESAIPEQIRPYSVQYKIQLFGSEQADEYFDRVFNRDEARGRIAKRIYAEMVDKSGTAPPLFCNLIATELTKALSLERIEKRLSNGEFRTATGIDEFIKTIISRETKLGIEWPIDRTIFALGALAMRSVGGPIGFNVARDILEDTFSGSLFVDISDAVKNFFFLEYNPKTNSLLFRYDFLRTIFLASHVAHKISAADIDIVNDTEMLDVLSRQLTPGSDVLNRIVSEEGLARSDQFLEVLEMLIQDIAKGKLRLKTERQSRGVTSNLLFLRLALDTNSRDADANTKLLERIFSGDEDAAVLGRVSLHYFGQDANREFKFNLSSKRLHGGSFVGTPIDELFRADEQTIFASCQLSRCLSGRQGRAATVWKARFEPTCVMDEEFSSNLRSFQVGIEASEEKKMSELGRFLKLFAAGHNFNRVRKEETLHGMFTSRMGISADEFLQALRRHGIIEVAPTGIGRQYQIAPKHRLGIRHFVMDSARTKDIEALIAEL